MVEQLLTVIEMVEVFLELAALQCGGPGARWAVIVAIQVLKWVLTSPYPHLVLSSVEL